MKLTSATYKKWKKIENEIIEKNKAKGVYYHEEIWLSKYTPEMLCELAGITNEKGAERTRKIAEALAKLDGVTVETKNDGTYNITVWTPYKCYLYCLRRGYDCYVTLEKGYIAPGGNTYRNIVFEAESAQDMQNRYHEHTSYY